MISWLTRRPTFITWELSTEYSARWFWRVTLSTGTEKLQLGVVLSRPVRGDRVWRLSVAFLIGMVALEIWPPGPAIEEHGDDGDAEVNHD